MKNMLCIFCLFIFAPNIVGEIARPRGTSISKAPLYATRAEFTCLDGSSTIPFSRINDDYCDCADASDEPGTAACPNGSFHCTNPGFRPKNIPSAWVNDGVCDCCDGTDEFEGGQCTNNCKELGKAMREKAEKDAELLKEGHAIYQDYVQRGQVAKKEKLERQVILEKERDELELNRGDLETMKEEAEKPETAAKDVHKQAWEEEKEHRKVEELKAQSANAFRELDVNQDFVVDTEEIQKHLEFDIDSNGEVSIEEAKEYLEDQQGVDEAFFLEKVWPNIKEIYKDSSEPVVVTSGDLSEQVTQETTTEVPPTGQEEPDLPDVNEGYTDDDEDDSYEDRDDDIDDDEDPEDHEEHDDEDDDHVSDPHLHGDDSYASEEPETPETPKEVKTDEMPEYDDATKLLIEAADKARGDFDKVDRQYKEFDSEITEIKKFIALDMGPNLEYYPLKGQCFDFKDREYIYSLCPFERASQRSKNGGSETSLGVWGHWAGDSENLYSAMKYEKGQNCWNGPDRSVKVIIFCGKNNEVLSATEPNRCEYEFKFSSPAACSTTSTDGADKNRDEL